MKKKSRLPFSKYKIIDFFGEKLQPFDMKYKEKIKLN